MVSKLRIKLGSLEVDYEGTDQFIKSQLPSLLKTLQGLRFQGDESVEGIEGGAEEVLVHKSNQLSTSTIAQKLGAKSGGELAMAAAARLSIVLKKATFTKKEILSEMRSATGVFKKSFANNIDNTLKRLTNSGSLLLQSDKTYAISADKKTEIGKKLG